MKLHKLFIYFLLIAFVTGCTTKSDTYYNRQFRMIPTMYNVLYNGNLALEEGKKELAEKRKDNYFEILEVEPEVRSQNYNLKGEGNPHFDRAEEKAIKAIQRHSMVFDGKQKNRKIDDAYMLLGKARYYNGRYIPALEAFNHLLTNYGETNQRYNAAVWREKAHIQLGREQLAVAALEKILEEEQPKRRERATLHAVLAQAFINLESYPKAIEALKQASQETKEKPKRGRYYFIIGQLFEHLQQKDSAQAYYQKVIGLNWNVPRRLWVEAQVGKARTQTLTPEEKIAYTKKLRKMEKLYEHKDLLDLVYFQHALFLEGENQSKAATNYFLRSLEKNKDNEGLRRRTHEHLGELYFKDKKYPLAYAHYDSTLVYIPKNTLEHLYMRRKRDNLAQITAFENTIAKADSLSRIMKMPKEEQIRYFERHIDSLKQQPATQQAVTITDFGRATTPQQQNPQEGFYFYLPQTVAYGKQLFKQRFGDRPLMDNWRWSNQLIAQQSTDVVTDSLAISQISPEDYLKKLPTPSELEQLQKDRETALYGVGELYWEKFADGKLAEQRLTRLLSLTHNDKLKEKTLYLLYKINEKNPKEADVYKQQLLTSFPNSEYAKPILGQQSTNEKELQEQYQRLSDQLAAQQYAEVLAYIQAHKTAYKTSSMGPDFDILKAKAIARLEGKAAYIRELEAIVQEYPNTSQADDLKEKLKILKGSSEKPTFLPDEEATSWKVVLQGGLDEQQLTQLKNYLEENGFAYLTLSQDVYDDKEQFAVLHGFMSKQMAEGFVQRVNHYFQENALKNKKKKDEEKNQENTMFFKEFFVISSENYAILQAFKNKEEYIKNN
nr:tetratricopeptide repeat protein [uncultured Capnocytophaga sp.]